MSYQVIARKWRPQSFLELVGQNHVSQTLLNALRHDRLHHALLFTGPRGTGKTSSARILAKSLRCTQAVDFVPCHVCPECLDIAAGRSVNVIEIDGASNNGVDAIRELRETVGYMPSSGRHKLYIIDEVHMLSTSAFNALLKTLEEPPPHVIFVLATTEAHKIPQTILSRVQRYDFRRISTREITERLQLICKTDGITAEEDALWMLARQGDGSMRDSLSLLDLVITFANDHLNLEKVTQILGLTDRSILLETIAALVARDTSATLKVLEKIFQAGYEPHLFAQDLLESIRNLMLIKISTEKLPIIELPDSEVSFLRKLGESLPEEDVHLLFDMALKGAGDLPRAQDPRLVLEMTLLRISAAPRVHSLLALLNAGGSASPGGTAPQSADPASKLSTSRPAPANASATTTATAAAAGAKTSPPATGFVSQGPSSAVGARPSTPAKNTGSPAQNTLKAVANEEHWLELVQKITQADALLAAKIEKLFFLGLEGKNLLLGIPEKMPFLKETLNDAQLRKKLESFIEQNWGPGYTLEVRLSGTPHAVSAEGMAEKKQQNRFEQIKAQVAEHPMVQSAQSVFNGHIKDNQGVKMKGMPGGMQQLMRQANQMQSRMKKTQEELAKKEYEATSGGGAVTIKVNGENKITALTIDAEVMKMGDVEMLQDMIMTATNEALKIAKDDHAQEMEKITGGMGIPGLF